MSYSGKVATNTIIQAGGRIISTAISFFIVGLLARKLGVYGYGEYTIVFSYLGLYAVIADFGFFYMLVRKLSAEEGDAKEISSHIISMRTVLAGLVYIASLFIVQLFPYSSEVKTAIGIGTISFLFVSIQNTIFGIFQVNYAMHWAVVGDIISRLVTLIFIYIVTQTKTDLSLIIGGYALGNGIGTLWLIFKARQYVPFVFKVDFKVWRKILGESVMFGLAIIFSYLYF
jgi:O-antigen/teichoic acid export membrane protein